MSEYHESSLSSIDGVKKAEIVRSRKRVLGSDYKFKKADLFDFNTEVGAEERIVHFENQLKY